MHGIRARHAFDGTGFVPGGALVLVEGDVIVGMEPARVDAPDGVDVASYDGTLLPGLIDTHVHLVADGSMAGAPGSLEWAGTAPPEEVDTVIEASLRAQAAAGVTTVRDLGDVGYLTLAHRDRAAAGLPRIVAAGPPVTTPGGHCHYLGGAVEPTNLERAVAERVERGVDLVKVMASGGFLTRGTDQLGAQFDIEALRTLVGASHAAGLGILAHTHSVVGAEVALSAGVDGLEHFTNLASGGPKVSRELLDRVAAAGVTVGPTLGNDPTRWPPPEETPPHILELLAGLGITDRDDYFTQLALNAGRLREHGIRVVSGLDAGAAPPKPHGDLWRAVGELVRGGWPVDEAVATATSVAAEECAVPAGRLAAGLGADLLVVDGELATDVAALSRPVAAWMRGVPVEAAGAGT